MAALVLTGALTGCGQGHGADRPRGLPAPAAPGLATRAGGARLGAYAQPAGGNTAAGRIAAVQALERATGHPLAVVHTYHIWTSPFPDAADRWAIATGHALLLSWNTTDTRDIAQGGQDALIKQRAHALAALGQPVLLEWRWEMDRPDLAGVIHSASDYIAAWKHLRAVFAREGVTNVGWVWCPTAYGFARGRAAQYYPGDDQVDWLCADVYGGPHYESLSHGLAPFLEWAAGHLKPIVVGEFGADADGAGSPDQVRWLQALAAAAPRMPAVKAYVYFDAVSVNAAGRRSDISLDSPAAMQAFAALQADPYFTPSGVP